MVLGAIVGRKLFKELRLETPLHFHLSRDSLTGGPEGLNS